MRTSVSGPSTSRSRSCSSVIVGADAPARRSTGRSLPGHDAHAVFARQPGEHVAPACGIDVVERGAQRAQLHDLRVGELPRDQRRAILVEQHDRGQRGERHDGDEQQHEAPEQRARPERHDVRASPAGWRWLPAARRRAGRTRSRSPTRSGCSADSPGRARRACAGATPARRSRDRTPRGRGRARAASASRARAAGADAARTP